MRVIDSTDRSARQVRHRQLTQGFMIHRSGIDRKTGVVLGRTGPEIDAVFTGQDDRYLAIAEVTNYTRPYTFYVGGDGIIWQSLPMNVLGYHARSFSHAYMGIACIGDFRVEPPVEPQWNALVWLLGNLCQAFNRRADFSIRGHGEVQGGEKASYAAGACPGNSLDIGFLRAAVAEQWHVGAIGRLCDAGAVWP